MTDAGDILLALVLAAIWNVAIVSTIRRRIPGPDGVFLARVYTATLLCRYALALFLNAYSDDSAFAATFWGDSGTYDSGGHLLALSWRGELLVNPYMTRSVSGYGFFYLVAALYYIFGRNQLLVQLLNGTIGAVTVLIIYGIASSLFDKRAGRKAALFMAFFPQMVFWSAAMYKDPAVMFCIALCMYVVIKLREHFRLSLVMLYIASALVLMSLRFYIFYFVAFASLGTFGFAQRKGLMRGFLPQAALVIAFVAAFSFAAEKETVERHSAYFDLKQLQVVRSDQATWGKSAFATQGDVSTVGGALSALPVGLVYLLFAPFPWAISGLRQALTVPETLVWYGLMPAFLRGLRYTIRHRFREALPIMVFAVTLTCAYALFQGNVGTAYRQRTQVSMFFFILMGVGLVQKQDARERPRLVVPHPALPR